jgi:ubiquinone/menaquinone biosynthesis C-methylase UbiE
VAFVSSSIEEDSYRMGELESLGRTWDSLGHSNPMWAILTTPQSQHWDPEEFFSTGEQEVATEFAYLESLDIEWGRGRALDFGCGLGRLTQPLADRFDEAVGVDIAASMIEGARTANKRGSRCQFVLNERDDLTVFPDETFDFVFSLLVLQHMPPTLSERYMAEFVRVLKPGGIGYFQMTEYSRNPVRRFLMKYVPIETLYWLLRHRTRPPFKMYGRDLDEIVAVLTSVGADVVGVRTRSYGRNFWLDHRIVLRKRSLA